MGGLDPVLTSDMVHQPPVTSTDQLWAEQYLEDVPVLESQAPSLDPAEFQEFIASVGRDQSVSENVTVGNGETIECECDNNECGLVESAEKSDEWVEEFSQFTQSDTNNLEKSESFKQEFWRKLEEEWKEVSQADQDHPWLSDLNSTFDPFKEYKFSQDNPTQNHPDPLEEGKKMLALGDLPSAVLYFESAVHHHPDNAEAWQLLGRDK